MARVVTMGAMANLFDLSLRDNRIGDEGMKAFASAIAIGALPSLQTLWLHGNPGDEKPAKKELAERKK